MELIYNNSKQFNGEQSEYTAKAKKLLDFTKDKMYQEVADDYLAKLEEIIQEESGDQGELESVGKSFLIRAERSEFHFSYKYLLHKTTSI